MRTMARSGMRGWYSLGRGPALGRAPGIVARDAPRVRAALHRLRLRARSSADAAAVRAGHRPAAGGRGRAGARARAGRGRGAAVVPHPALPRRRSSASRSTRSGSRRSGIGEGGDCPPFAGMHEASAAVAGGSLRAVEAILRGDVEHAQHPGGGLHHAMPERASGFCIYDDPALAIARARRDGLRVLYIDLDVHHGDGVQAIHWDDPGVLTFSIHETGRALFPGTGDVDEVGEGVAAGTSVNVPLPPGTGERAWLDAVTLLLPELAATFAPDLIVSQHGADSHAWDPLAHLNVTTTAHGRGGPARRRDRAPPRAGSLAGDGRRRLRRVPGRAADLGADLAGRCASRGPGRRRRRPGASDGRPRRHGTGRRRSPSGSTTNRMPGSSSTPRRRPWRSGRPGSRRSSGACSCRGSSRSGATAGGGTRSRPSPRRDARGRARQRRRRRSSPTSTPRPGSACRWRRGSSRRPIRGRPTHSSLAGLADGARVDGRRRRADGRRSSRSPGSTARPRSCWPSVSRPAQRRQGLAGGLLAAHASADRASTAEVTLAERDVVEPLDRADRATIARRLLVRAGYRVESAPGRRSLGRSIGDRRPAGAGMTGAAAPDGLPVARPRRRPAGRGDRARWLRRSAPSARGPSARRSTRSSRSACSTSGSARASSASTGSAAATRPSCSRPTGGRRGASGSSILFGAIIERRARRAP